MNMKSVEIFHKRSGGRGGGVKLKFFKLLGGGVLKNSLKILHTFSLFLKVSLKHINI